MLDKREAGMNLSKRAASADSVARPEPAKSRSRFNAYPLLGVLLAIALAVLTYGGLYFLLCD